MIVREHARYPHLIEQGAWGEATRIDTGRVVEQAIQFQGIHDPAAPAPVAWRRIAITLNSPTEAGETVIRQWAQLPATIDAATIAALYRKRWRIEGMCQRLGSVLHSEIKSLGHPRAARLGCTVAVLAYNVLSLLQRAAECAHRPEQPRLEVSTYHLAEHVKSGYEGMLIAVPAEHWPEATRETTESLAERLLRLARRILPKQVATSKSVKNIKKPNDYVDFRIARSHVSTARGLKQASGERP